MSRLSPKIFLQFLSRPCFPSRGVLFSSANITYIGISRRGDAVLRRASYLAALTAIKVNPIIKRFYEEHKGRLRGRKLIVACTRKLAVIIWAVLYYRPFDASE
ncbi:transposase [Saccharolobus islandicus]|uniref:transposase n=1 Tax=Saccharolobus islandicus TaxID=43080 RepID=UPI0021579376|nr:transposase [Sulfolobus islandicus]